MSDPTPTPDLVTVECARCHKPITTDMAPAGTLSFCGECAPIVRPGLYADPAPKDLVELIWELIVSFKREASPSLRLSLCLGPFAWRDLKATQSPLLVRADPSNEPAFFGYPIYEVFDAGSHAVYMRVGPPSRKSRGLDG